MTLKKKFSYKDILYKSKRLTVLALVLVFGTGVVVTASLEKNNEIPVHDGEVLVDSLSVNEAKKTDTDDFQKLRAQTELERNKLISTLDSTINNSTNDAEKKNASEEKKRIMGYMEKEVAIESIIKSKNLPQSLVLITENSISVTVDKQELDTNTVAKICDIVMRETGKPADKIVIQSI